MPETVKSELLSDADRSHKCDSQEKVCWMMYLPLDKSHFITDLDTFQELLKRRVYTYIVTIDGLSDTHNAHRPLKNGGETFRQVIDNLKDISRNCRARRYKIQIRTNVTCDMYDSFLQYLQFLENEFGDNKNFSFLFSPVYDWGGEGVKDLSDKLVDGIDMFYKLLRDSGIKLNVSDLFYHIENRICGYATRNTYTIRPDGRILICPQLNHLEFGILDNGKLKLNDIAVAKWTNMTSESIEGCQCCSEYPLCEGRVCPANLYRIEETVKKLPCGREYSELEAILKTLFVLHKERFIQL